MKSALKRVRFYIVSDIALRAVISAKVVAVAKTTHKFIVYRHASLIALLPRN